MPKKYFSDQLDDEVLLLVFNKHSIVIRKGIIVAMVALLLGTVALFFKSEFYYFFGGLGAGLLLSIIVFFPWWLTWYYSVFIITDQRLIQVNQNGFWHRSVIDIGLNQIQMVNYQVAGLEQTLLGYGTIMMQTFVGDLVIHDIHHPAKVQKKLLGVLRKHGIIAINPPHLSTEGTSEEQV